MKVIMLCLIFTSGLSKMDAQQIISLPYEKPSDFEWVGEEKDYHSEHWNTRVITNVSKPSLIVYRPDDKINSGVGVVVAPGGGMYAHSIDSEGNWVADWLVKKGITVFVLMYRLVPFVGDAVSAFGDPNENAEIKAKAILPYAINDGLEAIKYIREHNDIYNIDKNKLGFLGFSAGGAITVGLTLKAKPDEMPNFIVPVYPWLSIVDNFNPEIIVVPPMLVICASDDQLGLASYSIKLYQNWIEKGNSAALHMYSKGGHGFGMRTQNLATDNWIHRFYEWLIDEGFVK